MFSMTETIAELDRCSITTNTLFCSDITSIYQRSSNLLTLHEKQILIKSIN